MTEKILQLMQSQIMGMSLAKKLDIETLTTDQLNTLRHECGNIKPNAPASLRISAIILDACAEAILSERK